MTYRGPAADPVAAPPTGGDGAFGDNFPTQPIAPSAHRRPPPPWPHHAAPAGGASSRAPARPARSANRAAVAVAIAAIIGALGYLSWAASSPSGAHARSVPATSPETQARHAGAVPPRPPPPGSESRRGDRHGALGEADGAVPDGVTVFDDDIPAVANLDPGLLQVLREAATAAADDGVRFYVNSGWRSPEYQEQLLREAIAEYGSEEAAARWVATADTSLHVSGDAVDIGHSAATAWLSDHGAGYGLCQIYRNEPWHYELRPEAIDGGCPPPYADPTHDPRTQR